MVLGPTVLAESMLALARLATDGGDLPQMEELGTGRQNTGGGL